MKTWIRFNAREAVFFSEVDDRAHWIEAGQCYQRLALRATALDLRTDFINQRSKCRLSDPRFGALRSAIKRP